MFFLKANVLASITERIGPKSTKTPHSRRSKLTSLFRHLTLRNLMEYCTIALNEASNNSCSNKFDLGSCNSSVWLLGKEYRLPNEEEELIKDIRTKLWITYRKNFPPLDENTRCTTDRGFGCMIRCGQMVLANSLLHQNLGRDWRWSPQGFEENPLVYRKILRLFHDREDCQYSIHKIVQTSQHEGKSVGEWFGPNTIAQALKRLSASYFSSEQPDYETMISIDVALDNVVVIDEIKSKFFHNVNTTNSCSNSSTNATSDGDKDIWIPGLLFIQLRLGLTKINPLYFDALKKTFQFENSQGIIGGRPNHALFLIGVTDDDIIYLDPHSTQQYVDLEEGRTISDDTYHCSLPEKMPLDRLDPSLALCFLFRSEKEFDNWINQARILLVDSERTPMFEITNCRRFCDITELEGGLLEEVDDVGAEVGYNLDELEELNPEIN